MSAERPVNAMYDPETGETAYVPFTDEEMAEKAARDAVQLEDQRSGVATEVKSALAATDKWAARAYEDGVPMPADRVAYRKALRALLGKIEAATTQAQLDKITLPEPPPPPA